MSKIDNVLATYPMSSREINRLIDKIDMSTDIADDGYPVGLTDLEKQQYDNIIGPLQFYAAQIARQAMAVFDEQVKDWDTRVDTRVNGREFIRNGLMLNSTPEEVQKLISQALLDDFNRVRLEFELAYRLKGIFPWQKEDVTWKNADAPINLGLDWALEMYDKYGARSDEDFRRLAIRQAIRY
jgi:hypothetical protein